MNSLSRMLRRIMWVTCACVLLVAHAAAAGDRSVVADFDGDGQYDSATLVQRGSSSLIRVWLSSTHAIAIVHSSTPIAGIAGADIDGDRREELIGTASTRLHVWTVRHGKLERLTPRKTSAGAIAGTTRHHVEEEDDIPVAVASAKAPGAALAASSPARAAGLARGHVSGDFTAPASSRHIVPSLAPRPPPPSR